jgi:hypothetical protein
MLTSRWYGIEGSVVGESKWPPGIDPKTIDEQGCPALKLKLCIT